MIINLRALIALTTLLILLVPMISPSTSGLFHYTSVSKLTVKAPALSSSGRGVLSNITLAVACPGSGRVFFSALPYTEVETQGAARVAAYVASTALGFDFSNYDYYVLVESSTPLVGGPSAGGLIAVGFAALLLNITIREKVTMTGMINPDGSIGPVGGLKEKLDAAASYGFRVFLIPSGQRFINYPRYEVVRLGPFVTVTRVTYETVDLVEYGERLGIEVVEITNIADAIYYFTGVNVTSGRIVSEVPGYLKAPLRAFFSNLSFKVGTTLADLTVMARKVGGYYGYRYISTAIELNSTYNKIITIEPFYPVYAVLSLLKLYEDALKAYWTISLIVDKDFTNNVVDTLNKTLASAINEMYLEECSVDNSFIQATLINAWLHYLGVRDVNSASEMITRAAAAMRLIETARMYWSLVNASNSVVMECSIKVYTNLYSNALGIYTYVTKLLEEVGASAKALSSATEYVNVLNYAYENNNTGTIGAAVLVIGYSISTIHTIFNTIDTVIGNKDKMLVLYPYPLRGVSVIYSLIAELSNEADQLRDTSTSIMAYSHVVALLQTFSSLYSSAATVSGASSGSPKANNIGEGATSNENKTEAHQAVPSRALPEALTLIASLIVATLLVATLYLKSRQIRTIVEGQHNCIISLKTKISMTNT